jgi:S-methylmethionine-dependent homocysteine/selenocysteine methylase
MPDHVVIMDGGMGRLLESMGAPFRLPEWSALAVIEAPEYVEMAHRAYVEAGAEIIITNTYSLVPNDIGRERFEKEGRELISRAAQIARKVAKSADHDVLIAGSLPPAFGSYRPDLFQKDKAEEIYKPLIEEQNPYVDIMLAETASSIAEVETIGHFVKELSDKPYWISYTLTDRNNKDTPPQLRSGESLADAIQAAKELGAQALLYNCSQPEEMEPALKITRDTNPGIPYGVYANTFPPVPADHVTHDGLFKLRQDMTPELYLELARKWKKAGASVIGGCCGIMPEHIKALSRLNA